ncbi:MAG: hypothetical protein ACLU37_04380 [Collinsella sp.]
MAHTGNWRRGNDIPMIRPRAWYRVLRQAQDARSRPFTIDERNLMLAMDIILRD